MQPIGDPTSQPLVRPSAQPSRQPTQQPSSLPTMQPLVEPTSNPTVDPSAHPSRQPTQQPSSLPSMQPLSSPTAKPIFHPTSEPSTQPTSTPSAQPTEAAIISSLSSSSKDKLSSGAVAGISLSMIFVGSGVSLAYFSKPICFAILKKYNWNENNNNGLITGLCSQFFGESYLQQQNTNVKPKPQPDIEMVATTVNPISNKDPAAVYHAHITYPKNSLFFHPEILEIAKEARKLGVLNHMLDYNFNEQEYKNFNEIVREFGVKETIKMLYASDQVAVNKEFKIPQFEYSSSLINNLLIARNIIEYLPIAKIFSPELAHNFTSILDNKMIQFKTHLALGTLGAILYPVDNIKNALVASSAGSLSFAMRLISTSYLDQQRDEVLLKDKQMNAFETTKYCLSTVIAYTLPSMATCALAKYIISGYECNDLNWAAKVSFASAECYSLYQTSKQELITTLDILLPYTMDAIALTGSLFIFDNPLSSLPLVIATDIATKIIMDVVPLELKEEVVEYVNEVYSFGLNSINLMLGITEDL
jgi:hypothetical protein